nr:PIG-L deacetylase family protein [Notoacmeibacter sp. MSK16QG-6]
MPERLAGGAPILVLAPHPDDESLACGALLAACFETVGAHVACVTDGRFSHPNSRKWSGDHIAKLRRCELTEAIGVLGGKADAMTWLGYRDCHAPTDEEDCHEAVEELLALISRLGAKSVFSTASADPHKDHKAVSRLGRRLLRHRPDLRLFEYSVWARWNFRQYESEGLRIRSGDWRDRKEAAIACHRSQRGEVIDDDPEGFAMAPGFAEFFTAHDEYFAEVRP